VIKFLAVKTIVFATYYQGLVLLAINGGGEKLPSHNSTYHSNPTGLFDHSTTAAANSITNSFKLQARSESRNTSFVMNYRIDTLHTTPDSPLLAMVEEGPYSATDPATDTSTTDKSEQWVAFILCIEMVLFAMLLHKAFPADEFKDETSSVNKSPWQALLEVLNIRDVVADTRHSFSRNYVDQGSGRGESFLTQGQLEQQGQLRGRSSLPIASGRQALSVVSATDMYADL
jgi:hypothetical protein